MVSFTKEERIQSLWSGYGEVLRVRLEGGRPAIVKWVKPPAKATNDASHRRKCRSYDVEARFYRAFAPRCDDSCRIPSLIDLTTSKNEWLFVLEDLDEAGFTGRRHGLRHEETVQCLLWLASFHARFLGVTPDGLWSEGTYWHLATRQEELANVEPWIREAAPLLDARLRAAKHRTLVHGDAKPANFCFGRESVAALDFQYPGGGTGMRDVAYLLSDEPDPSRYLDVYFRALSRPDVEAEWRALYPIALADYHRFLAGWSPRHFQSDRRAQSQLRDAVRTL